MEKAVSEPERSILFPKSVQEARKRMFHYNGWLTETRGFWLRKDMVVHTNIQAVSAAYTFLYTPIYIHGDMQSLPFQKLEGVEQIYLGLKLRSFRPEKK